MLWDPYEILNVAQGTPKREVAKAFRKLALKWHPDKVEDSLKEMATVKYGEINKAYKTLTNDDARDLWEEFGHPDGKQGNKNM